MRATQKKAWLVPTGSELSNVIVLVESTNLKPTRDELGRILKKEGIPGLVEQAELLPVYDGVSGRGY